MNSELLVAAYDFVGSTESYLSRALVAFGLFESQIIIGLSTRKDKVLLLRELGYIYHAYINHVSKNTDLSVLMF